MSSNTNNVRLLRAMAFLTLLFAVGHAGISAAAWRVTEQPELKQALDGFIWTYLKNVLVRIDPKDASLHVAGKLDPVGRPTFVGNDLYLSGSEQLGRIRNIAVK